MASSIGTVAQLVDSIRTQLGRSAAFVPSAPVTRPRQSPLQSNSYSQENLESLIGQRVKLIGRDDPQRGRKAFRVFLEAVLLSQLGEQLINDPKFYQLLDDVQSAIESDLALRTMVNQATAHLLGPD
jgi:hypothetical protein